MEDPEIPDTGNYSTASALPWARNRLFPVFWPRVVQKLFYHDRSQDALWRIGMLMGHATSGIIVVRRY